MILYSVGVQYSCGLRTALPCYPYTWWLHQAWAELLFLSGGGPAASGQAAETSPMDQFQTGWREVGSLPSAGTVQDGWMGTCAPSHHFGAGNLKSLLPLSPRGALTTCKCARIFLG